MNSDLRAQELDLKIEQLISAQRTAPDRNGLARNSRPTEAGVFAHPLLEIASELCLLPSEEFKAELKEQLMERAEAAPTENARERSALDLFPAESDLLPTLTQRQFAVLPADPRSFLLSFMSHAVAVALIASGIWIGQRAIETKPPFLSEMVYTPMPAGEAVPQGGGGGGDESPIRASHGTPPKFSNEQLAPPAIVVRNSTSKLQVEPTVLGPPPLKLPESNQIGDLFSRNLVIPSNGSGSHGGVGSNVGTGVGSGTSAGVGPGSIAGFGDGVYRPGNGVSAPRAIYDPDPEYSEEARKARYQGIVVLSLLVDPSGRARDIRVARALGMGLDEKAIAAVEQWRFVPGMKDGHPVAVRVNVEVSFRLY